MMVKPGDRVGAIESQDGNNVNFFGFGVYDGDFEPPENLQIKAWESTIPEIRNPRISLDKGGYIWGMESWWGAEESVKKFLVGKTIIDVKGGDPVGEGQGQNQGSSDDAQG